MVPVERRVPAPSGRIPVALVSGFAVGTAASILAVGLYHLCDPNLRLAGARGFLRAAWHGIPGYVLAAIVTALTSLWLGRFDGSQGRRGVAILLSIAMPWLWLAFALVMSESTSLPFDYRALGLVITRSEVVFLAFYAAMSIAAAPLLHRWIDWLRHGGVPTVPRTTWVLAVLSVGAVGLLAVGSAGTTKAPGAEPSASSRRLVLIAVDGLEWRTLRTLMARNTLPIFSRLIEAGASGSLSTFRPTDSPLIWTTIATGHPPSRHGIKEFVDGATGIPVTSNMRRVPALWNLLGDQGVDVGIVGWWATWPAERVNGQMVSSSSIPAQGTFKGTFLAELENQTYPPALMDEIRPLVSPAIQSGKEDVARFLAGDDPSGRKRAAERRFVASWVFGADRIFGAVGRHLSEQYAPHFLAVYFSATDTVGHLYCEGQDTTAQRCRASVEAAYRGVDREVGDLLESLPSDVTVLLLSDHGFDLAKGHEGAGRINGLPGVVLMKGPGVRPGGSIRSASIYDITPTILAFFGLPIAEDLRGKPLLTAFERDYVHGIEIAYEPSRRRGFAASGALPIASSTDEAVRERLRVLGYIE